MLPLRPISPPPERVRVDTVRCIALKRKTSARYRGCLSAVISSAALTGFMPKLHMFYTGSDELVRQVGIYFHDKDLVFASTENTTVFIINEADWMCSKFYIIQNVFFLSPTSSPPSVFMEITPLILCNPLDRTGKYGTKIREGTWQSYTQSSFFI